MSSEVELAHQALGLLDTVCGFFLVWAMQRTTSDAGFRSIKAKWALYRRTVYATMAIAVFGLGMKRVFGDTNDISYAILQAVLLIGVCSFIGLRATGFISQDVFTDGDSAERRRSRDAQ